MTSSIDMGIPQVFEPLFYSKFRNNILKGGRGSGKSETMARVLLLAAIQRDEKILCTREVQNSIKESVYALLEDVINQYDLPFVATKEAIRCTINDSVFIFKGLKDHTVQSIKSIKGVTKCWVEEAQMVSKKSLELLDPTIREPGSQLYFTYNPLDELDPIFVRYEEHADDNTLVITANWYDNKFFPEVLNDVRLKDKKRNLEDYTHIWEGQPMSHGENVVFSYSRIRESMDRVIDNPEGPIEIGVDVAREGSDKVCIYKRKGLKVIKRWSSDKPIRTWNVATKVLEIAGDKFDLIRVDDTGVGGGVTDELIRLAGHSKVIGVNMASKQGIDKDKYPNMSSFLYFHFEENYLDKADLPHDLELLKELGLRKYHRKNTLKLRQVESKEEFKKRLGHSPDDSDALLLCYSGPNIETLEYQFI